MSKKSTSTTLRLDRSLVEAADRFARKYTGHNRHWAIAHWCRLGAIKDGVYLEPSDDHAQSLAAVLPLGKSPQTRLTVRIDADVYQAAIEYEATSRKARHWWLVHWVEVGALADGAQLYDVDGKSSIGWGHGFSIGDDVTHCLRGHGVVIAVGPNMVTAMLDDGSAINGEPESFVRVES